MTVVYEARLRSVSPYSQSRYYSKDDVPALEKESAEAYDRRTWRHKLHTTASGQVYIPPMAIKNCLSEAAKYLSITIKGKGKATYTKHFEAGLLCPDPVMIGMSVDEVKSETLFVPASGIRGDGKRVTRTFPRIDEWAGVATIYVFDHVITQEILEQHLREAGNLIGIGRFRPRNNGFYGRFQVEGLTVTGNG